MTPSLPATTRQVGVHQELCVSCIAAAAAAALAKSDTSDTKIDMPSTFEETNDSSTSSQQVLSSSHPESQVTTNESSPSTDSEVTNKTEVP